MTDGQMPAHVIPAASASGISAGTSILSVGKPRSERKIILLKKPPCWMPPASRDSRCGEPVNGSIAAVEHSPQEPASPAEGTISKRCVDHEFPQLGAIRPPGGIQVEVSLYARLRESPRGRVCVAVRLGRVAMTRCAPRRLHRSLHSGLLVRKKKAADQSSPGTAIAVSLRSPGEGPSKVRVCVFLRETGARPPFPP